METGQKENATRAFLPINLIFLKKVGVVPRKAAKLEKVVRNLKKASFDSTKIKTGKWLGQTLFIFETPGIVAPAWARLDFDSDP